MPLPHCLLGPAVLPHNLRVNLTQQSEHITDPFVAMKDAYVQMLDAEVDLAVDAPKGLRQSPERTRVVPLPPLNKDTACFVPSIPVQQTGKEGKDQARNETSQLLFTFTFTC